MELATMKGKEFALEKLEERRAKSKAEEQINNASRPEGSFMYFYCIACGGLAEVLPELYNKPPKGLCDECQALHDLGWLE